MGFEYEDSDFRDLDSKLVATSDAYVYQRAAPEIERLLTEQFWAGTDPFGATWAPLVKTGDASHLIKTGALLSSLHITGRPGGFDFEMADYGGYHQYGTSKMVARPILPLGGEYPDSWDAAVADAVVQMLSPFAEGGPG